MGRARGGEVRLGRGGKIGGRGEGEIRKVFSGVTRTLLSE